MDEGKNGISGPDFSSSVAENVKRIFSGLPAGVTLVAASKTRTADEINDAVSAGVKIVGESYVQEALGKKTLVCGNVAWHLIGHLQKNKVNKAVGIFDLIETVDSLELAVLIDHAAGAAGKTMPVFVEINSAKEENKSGVMPEDTENFIRKIAGFENIRVAGLMTMGPLTEKPEDIRPYFRLTKEISEKIKSVNVPGVEMKYLSMGMSDTYRIAVEEGANIVRVGTAIFGPRGRKK